MVKRLQRDEQKGILTGVCAGIGGYFRVDPVLIRVIFIILAIFTAVIPVIITYILLAIIMPKRQTGPINITPKKRK